MGRCDSLYAKRVPRKSCPLCPFYFMCPLLTLPPQSCPGPHSYLGAKVLHAQSVREDMHQEREATLSICPSPCAVDISDEWVMGQKMLRENVFSKCYVLFIDLIQEIHVHVKRHFPQNKVYREKYPPPYLHPLDPLLPPQRVLISHVPLQRS